MIKLNVIEGNALPLPIENLNTDQIMPKQFLRGIDKSGLDKGLFYDMRFDSKGNPRKDSILNDPRYRGAPILLGGANFGCGSSREHAVWGLVQYGFKAVIAPSFAEIFYGNAMNNRLLTVELAPTEVDELVRDAEKDPKTRLHIDIEQQTVTSGNGRVFKFPIGARHKQMVIEGLDMIDLTLKSLDRIEAFEKEHHRRHPWAVVGEARPDDPQQNRIPPGRSGTGLTVTKENGNEHMNTELLNRGNFAASAALGKESSAQEHSPSRLEELLPSTVPSPKPGSEVPLLPAPPSPQITEKLFPGFHATTLETSGAKIRVLTKGTGKPLLLLHGHPETMVTWHKIASELAENYQVVLTDLRGYGDSSKPDGGDNHVNYSFRAMAQDQVEVMHQLGHNRFFLAGHDRGARVAHRLCLDHPEAVEKVALLDIAPTLTMYQDTNKEFASRYVWWFFQIQPYPVPEHFIGLDPLYYLRDHLFVQSKTPGAVSPEAMAEYQRCYCSLQSIHACCEDYRAAASIDLDMDRADDAAGHKIACPLHVLWGAEGTVGHLWNVLETWKPKASGPVTGRALKCGHLLPEEQPAQVLTELRGFLRELM